MNGNVTMQHQNGIATITFYHPQSNSMPGVLLRQLADVITDAGNNDAIKVIVLQSSGDKSFCAGASFDELISIENLEQGKYFFSGFASVINAMRKAPKFIIARIQGKAVGGGVGIAAAADYTVATIAAQVKLSELAVGIGPFVVGPAVERKLGTAAFSQLAINATAWQSAEWAHQHGLYSHIYNDAAAMDEAIASLTQTLAASNPEAMMMLKQVFWQGTQHWDQLLLERAQMSGTLVLSNFTRNAIQAFKKGVR
ncbi:MAG: enoyl-CoA hydratase/isomerase family protein [Bacteroidia bacterium]|nr:enoyl-CoA hydratase/isomerase family protein [Bacteroidia bacterium]